MAPFPKSLSLIGGGRYPLRDYCRRARVLRTACGEGCNLDRATLIGLVATCIVVLTASARWIGSFVDFAAIVLVIGGTLLVTLMKFSFRQYSAGPAREAPADTSRRRGARRAHRPENRLERSMPN